MEYKIENSKISLEMEKMIIQTKSLHTLPWPQRPKRNWIVLTGINAELLSWDPFALFDNFVPI